LKGGAREALRRRARRIKTELFAVYLACKDPRTPWYTKAIVAGVVGYAFSPIDLIPDFIPVVGYLDDLVLIPLGLALAAKSIPRAVLADCRRRAADAMSRPRPTSRAAAGVVIALWLCLAALAAWLLIKM
jgi:uncharacterized membrane protein YkvA (DUF1232 family)